MQESIKIIILFILVTAANSRPVMWLESPEEYVLQDFENHVLSPSEMGNYLYATTSEASVTSLELDTTVKLDNETLRTIGKLMRKGLTLRNALQEVKKTVTTPETITSIYIEEVFQTTLPNNNKQDKIVNKTNYTLQLEDERDNSSGSGRSSRQEVEGDEMVKDDDREARQESSEEESDEDEGGGGGGFGGLISAFLSSLSKPDGGVDVDAIASLIGSLSTQNPDGSYNFNGLTELLMSFFGGDEEGGGGSDIGRFLGGLIGAFIKGVAQPPGARGAGIFTGKVLGGILPALSAADETPTDQPPQKDTVGFLSGLLGTFSGGNGNGGEGSKFPVIKTIIGMFTSILTSSSMSSSQKSW